MKSSYWLPLAVAVAAGSLLAQSPTPPKSANGTPQVLLLADFQIVQGRVEQVGAEYHVRRGKDIEKFPVQQVIFVGDSLYAVQQYLKTRSLSPKPAGPPTPGGVNSAALRGFPARVQPVLMNLCADCHAAPDHPGNFKLDRVRQGYANPEANRQNAEAVIRFLDRDDPSASPLLMKAVTAHGGQKAPALKDRIHPAYRRLELWAHWAVKLEGSMMPQIVPSRSKDAAKPTPAPSVPVTSSQDPYDPGAFNRSVHLKR